MSTEWQALKKGNPPARYTTVSRRKREGETYTPKGLANFVALNMVNAIKGDFSNNQIRILDPAIGDGALLISLIEQLTDRYPALNIEVHGFDLNKDALKTAAERINDCFPTIVTCFKSADFLEFVLAQCGASEQNALFNERPPKVYDLIIANPPYVRTQVMGAGKAQMIAKQFDLSGRVDLYYAFIVAIAQVLKPTGITGIIVSNRFMTTRSGAPVRQFLLEKYALQKIWDFGDTKLFEASVLPAVLIAQPKTEESVTRPTFTSIYQIADTTTDKTTSKTTGTPERKVLSPIEALSHYGVVQVEDGRRFLVQQGHLKVSDSTQVWCLSNEEIDQWLATIEAYTWGLFQDIGKIRVGVKTCADKVFIRSDWQDFPNNERPELLKPLATHHVARRFKAIELERPRQILYTHEVVNGTRRPIELSEYPASKAYLERHRSTLENRKYVIKAKRKWYEIWVPQDPSAWAQPKLVFRDIAERATFWIDQEGSVVNGDCYWMTCHHSSDTDLLWLAAAVANSTFIEQFYDRRFQNKLYSGRRRYITQYVEQFPLPDPNSELGQSIIAKVKQVYTLIPSTEAEQLQVEIEKMVWAAFGLPYHVPTTELIQSR